MLAAPAELVRTGIVELVLLQNLIGPDVPHFSGLPLVMHNIVTSIKKQLIRCSSEPDWNKEVVPFVEAMNWEGICSKVKQVYEAFLKKQS
jgi:hypothetical protein